MHNLAAIPVFAGLPPAAARYGWRDGQTPGFAIYCAATAVTMPSPWRWPDQVSAVIPAGPLQWTVPATSIITGFAWLTAVSARVLKRTLPGTVRTSR
jgi:hypothetical protein